MIFTLSVVVVYLFSFYLSSVLCEPILKPLNTTKESVYFEYQLPDSSRASQNVALLFHGCNHDASDWFILPEVDFQLDKKIPTAPPRNDGW